MSPRRKNTKRSPNPGSEPTSLAERNRLRLKEIESQLAANSGVPTTGSTHQQQQNITNEGAELNSFLKDLVEKKKRHKHQLTILMEFFQDPLRFGVEMTNISSSSSAAELEQRKKELTFRVSLLGALLESAEHELRLLKQTNPKLTESEQNQGE